MFGLLLEILNTSCVNDPDIFSYMGGSFVPSVQGQNRTPFVKMFIMLILVLS